MRSRFVMSSWRFSGIASCAVVLFLAFLLAPAAPAAAADTQRGSPVQQRLPAAPATPKGAPPSPAQAVPTPALPHVQAPDYAISVATQQDHANGRLSVKFRVENKGDAKGPSAMIRVRRGNPCPGGEDWKNIDGGEIKVKPLDPGAAVVLPVYDVFITPMEYAGKGCRYEVELRGDMGWKWGDSNPANDKMHLYTKKLSLPDLVIEKRFEKNVGSKKYYEIHVVNKGAGPADPSVADYYFKPGKDKPEVAKKVSVPSLAPGQSYRLFGGVPEFWEKDLEIHAYADINNDVPEQNEQNNDYPPLK